MTDSPRDKQLYLFGHIHQAVVTGVVIRQTLHHVTIDSTTSPEKDNFIKIRLPKGLRTDIRGCRIYAKARLYCSSLIMVNFREFEPTGGELKELEGTEDEEDGEEETGIDTEG